MSDTHMNGCVKWFNKKTGYGFITSTDASGIDSDVFVHHSAILTEVDQYRYLVEGEYVKFTIKPGDTNAVDVTGPTGGKLMCETRQTRRSTYDTSEHKHVIRDETPRRQPVQRFGPDRKQVYVSGDIDDGCVWELVRRLPKSEPSPSSHRNTSRGKGPKIVVDS